jgi:hypothetical protein
VPCHRSWWTPEIPFRGMRHHIWPRKRWPAPPGVAALTPVFASLSFTRYVADTHTLPTMALYLELSTRSVLGSLIVLGIILFAWSNKRKEKLPPGPGGLPILGNLLQIPKDRAWLVFSEWHKTCSMLLFRASWPGN